MDYSICSLNVRGLGQKTKRKQMFNFLEKNQFNICFYKRRIRKQKLKHDGHMKVNSIFSLVVEVAQVAVYAF